VRRSQWAPGTIHQRRHWKLAGALLALAVTAVVAVESWRGSVPWRSRSGADPATQTTADPATAATDLAAAKLSQPPTATSNQRQPDGGTGASPDLEVGGLRLTVSMAPGGDPAIGEAFQRAVLRRAPDLTAVAAGHAGARVELYLQPSQLSDTDQAGLQWRSCRLTAHCAIEEPTGRIDLAPVSAVRAQGDDLAACSQAAETLAEALLREVAHTLKEGS
jgi:hypothetical protein